MFGLATRSGEDWVSITRLPRAPHWPQALKHLMLSSSYDLKYRSIRGLAQPACIMPMGTYVTKTKEIHSILAKTWYFCPMFKDNPSFWLCISLSNLQSMRERQGKFKHKPDRRDSREISQHPNLSGQTLLKSSGGRLNVGWYMMLADSCSWLKYYTIASTAVHTSWSKTPTPWLYKWLLR